VTDDDDRPNPFALLTGLRRERRGKAPAHNDAPRPLLTAEQAARIARDRLDQWRRDHGQ
jgi:hypothetical protein